MGSDLRATRVEMKQLLPLALVLAACSATTTRREDAGVVAEMDAAITTDAPDARAADAYRLDAAAPDASTQDASRRDASTQDAFVPPGERCNGLDEDFDGRIDETAICSGTRECAGGTCQCVPGTYACNPARPEVCDVTDITTRALRWVLAVYGGGGLLDCNWHASVRANADRRLHCGIRDVGNHLHHSRIRQSRCVSRS